MVKHKIDDAFNKTFAIPIVISKSIYESLKWF